MYCRKCGSKLPDDSVFCFKCGTRIELLSATTCGKDRVRNRRFLAWWKPFWRTKLFSESVKYFCELLTLLFCIGFSLAVMALISEAVLPFFVKDQQVRFIMATSLSPIYLVWPIEWIMFKWNNPRAVRIAGNLLLVAILVWLILIILGDGYARSLWHGGSMWMYVVNMIKMQIPVFIICAFIVVYRRRKKEKAKLRRIYVDACAKMLQERDSRFESSIKNVPDGLKEKLNLDCLGCLCAIVVLYQIYSMEKETPENRLSEFAWRYATLLNSLKKCRCDLLVECMRYYVTIFIPHEKYSDVKNLDDYEMIKILPEVVKAFHERYPMMSKEQLKLIFSRVLQLAKSTASEMLLKYPRSLANENNIDYILYKCILVDTKKYIRDKKVNPVCQGIMSMRPGPVDALAAGARLRKDEEEQATSDGRNFRDRPQRMMNEEL